jgi:hypothetical protein
MAHTPDAVAVFVITQTVELEMRAAWMGKDGEGFLSSIWSGDGNFSFCPNT